MADPSSTASGAPGLPGLIPVLVDVCTKGYGLLATARNVSESRDWEDLQWRRGVEEGRFAEWKRRMKFYDGDISTFITPHTRRYVPVVEVLAKIVNCFHELDEFESTDQPSPPIIVTAGLPTDSSSHSRSDGQRERKRLRFRDLKFWKPKAGSTLPPLNTDASSSAISIHSPSPDKMTSEHLNFPSVKDLEALLQRSYNDAAEVQKAVDQFQETAGKFQETTRDEVPWALSNAERLAKALVDLENLNDSLYEKTRVLIQTTRAQGSSFLYGPNFQEHNVRVRLPYQRNPRFCGRKDIMNRVIEILEPHYLAENSANPWEMLAGRRRTVILHGMGGMGKSQIALEYSHRFVHCYTSVFWIDADDSTRTSNTVYKIVEQLVGHYTTKWRATPDFTEIANIIGLPKTIDDTGRITQNKHEDPLKAIQAWLTKNDNRGWILFIDNADKLNELEKLIPPCDWGTIIITTRLPNLQRLGQCIEVEVIGAEAGLDLILKSAGKYGRNVDDFEMGEARTIVQTLGELPLALDQAGAYVSSLQIPFSAYRKKMKRGLKAGFSKKLPEPSLPAYKASILTTWEFAFKELSNDAQRILYLCAFLGNDNIPKDLFRRGKNAALWIMEANASIKGENKLDNALECLFALSLAKRIDSDDSFWIHPVVHAWAREKVDRTTQRQNAEETITLVASALANDEHQVSLDKWIFERRILSHLKACQDFIVEYFSGSESMNAARASYTIGSAYQSLGYHKQAEELYETALAGYEKVLGKNHPTTLDIVNDMAIVFQSQGRYIDALEWYRRSLAGCEETLGDGHVSTLSTVNNIALVMDSQGWYDEALLWYRRALEGKEKALGVDHPLTLATLNNIANVFNSQCQFDDALECYQRALAGLEKALGKDNPATMSTDNNIALVYDNQGRYDQALEGYRRVLAGKEKTLGTDHPSTLETLNNMGAIFHKLGRYEEALESYQRSLDGSEKTLGSEHPSTMNIVNNMGIIFHEQGHHDKALEWYRRALGGYLKAVGMDHSSTLNTLNNMALVYDSDKKYEQALEYYQKALEGKEKALGKDHPLTLNTVNNIALVYDNQGLYDNALEWYRRALEGCENTLGNDHPSTLVTVNNMAIVFDKQGRYDEAFEWNQRALEGQEKALGKDHPSTLATVNNMANLYHNQGQYSQALEFYQRALVGREKALGKDHPSTLDTASSLANVVDSQSRDNTITIG
ncbi:hypothetical protein RUND412_006204 [Rhizina undulata]